MSIQFQIPLKSCDDWWSYRIKIIKRIACQVRFLNKDTIPRESFDKRKGATSSAMIGDPSLNGALRVGGHVPKTLSSWHGDVCLFVTLDQHRKNIEHTVSDSNSDDCNLMGLAEKECWPHLKIFCVRLATLLAQATVLTCRTDLSLLSPTRL